MSDKKIGRPKSENPKTHRITVRLDDGTWKMLEKICEGYDISPSIVIRRGIEAVYQEPGRVNREKK